MFPARPTSERFPSRFWASDRPPLPETWGLSLTGAAWLCCSFGMGGGFDMRVLRSLALQDQLPARAVVALPQPSVGRQTLGRRGLQAPSRPAPAAAAMSGEAPSRSAALATSAASALRPLRARIW